MKINFAIITALTLIIISGCGTSGSKKSREEIKKELKKELKEELKAENKNESSGEQASSSKDLTKANQVQETGVKTIKAQFEMFVANTAGDFYVFKDPDGDETWYRKSREANGLDFAIGLKPGDQNTKYNGKWYEITYELRDEELKGTVTERPFILKATPASAPPEPPKWKSETLKDLMFLGVEPNWSLVLKETHAEYTPMGEETKRIAYNQAPSKDKASLTAYTTGNQNEILEISGTLPGSVSTRIMIKEESCSDGMSDNTYPYAIRLEFNGESVYEGCGRINNSNNLVNIEEIKKTKKIKEHVVSEVMHEPGNEFNISLKGTFDFKGHFTINPMSDMLNFHVDNEDKPGIKVKIENFTRPLFTSFNFSNEQEVMTALGKEKIKQIRNNEKVQAHIVFKNYQFGGKLDGYGGAKAEFVKMVN